MIFGNSKSKIKKKSQEVRTYKEPKKREGIQPQVGNVSHADLTRPLHWLKLKH